MPILSPPIFAVTGSQATPSEYVPSDPDSTDFNSDTPPYALFPQRDHIAHAALSDQCNLSDFKLPETEPVSSPNCPILESRAPSTSSHDSDKQDVVKIVDPYYDDLVDKYFAVKSAQKLGYFLFNL